MLKGPSGGSGSQDRQPRAMGKFESSVIDVSRTCKVTKAGSIFHYRSLVVVGNKKGTAGFGTAKSLEVAEATKKAERRAMKNLFYFDRSRGHTIHHDMRSKFGRTTVMLHAAQNGTGITV